MLYNFTFLLSSLFLVYFSFFSKFGRALYTGKYGTAILFFMASLIRSSSEST